MKFKYRYRHLSVTFLIAAALMFSVKNVKGKTFEQTTEDVSILFTHKVGPKLLQTDSSYVNDFGESFRVNRFRYYVSNIQFLNENTGRRYKIPGSYFLIDEAEPLSKQIDLKLPAGEYTSFSFILGVDSLKNVSGAQSGPLDPINGMFWTWQSGYIMAKLEGSTPVSTLPRKMFEYHIGGFKGQYNVLQTVHIPITKTMSDSKVAGPLMIHVTADINKWFNGKHPLRLSQFPACTTPGKLAHQFAENYITMFSADAIK